MSSDAPVAKRKSTAKKQQPAPVASPLVNKNRIDLFVPWLVKEDARTLGAVWDNDDKSWYVDDEVKSRIPENYQTLIEKYPGAYCACYDPSEAKQAGLAWRPISGLWWGSPAMAKKFPIMFLKNVKSSDRHVLKEHKCRFNPLHKSWYTTKDNYKAHTGILKQYE